MHDHEDPEKINLTKSVNSYTKLIKRIISQETFSFKRVAKNCFSADLVCNSTMLTSAAVISPSPHMAASWAAGTHVAEFSTAKMSVNLYRILKHLLPD